MARSPGGLISAGGVTTRVLRRTQDAGMTCCPPPLPFMDRTMEVLQPNWPSDVALESIVDAAARLLFEDRAQGVEIPVAVKVVRPRLLRASWRCHGESIARIRCRVVHARACPE